MPSDTVTVEFTRLQAEFLAQVLTTCRGDHARQAIQAKTHARRRMERDLAVITNELATAIKSALDETGRQSHN